MTWDVALPSDGGNVMSDDFKQIFNNLQKYKQAMNLEEALKNIQYDRSWGIYAEKIDGKFTLESPARYGRVIFENGGLLDDKEYVCNGEFPSDKRVEWCEDSEDDGVWDWQFMDHLIEILNEDE